MDAVNRISRIILLPLYINQNRPRRGASAVAGAVDVVVNVQTLTEDVLRLSVVKHRIQGSYPSLLIRKAGEDRFETCEDQGEELSGFDLYRIQDFIMELLSADGAGLRTGEIFQMAEKEGYAKRSVERALGRLRQSGRVKQPRKGLNVRAMSS